MFEVDGKNTHAMTGFAIFAPKGTAHTFQNVGESPGRLLAIVQPAVTDAFFIDLAAATAGMSQPDLCVVV